MYAASTLPAPKFALVLRVLTARLPIWGSFGSHDEDVDWVDDAAARMIDPSRDVDLSLKTRIRRNRHRPQSHRHLLFLRERFYAVIKSEGCLRMFPI